MATGTDQSTCPHGMKKLLAVAAVEFNAQALHFEPTSFQWGVVSGQFEAKPQRIFNDAAQLAHMEPE